MLFHEYTFLFLFLPLTLLGYYLLPSARRNGWLFLANLVFYSTTSWFFLPLLLFTIGLDYGVGAALSRARSRAAARAWLLLSLVVNLGTLGYFKYIGLITATLRRLPGLEAIPQLEAPLPAGISFYVFQSMSYTIDLYRGRVQRARSFRDFGAFVTLFPHLIAGPIVRFEKVERQLIEREHSVEKFAAGAQLLVLGLAKKLLVADTLATLADPLFAGGTPGGFLPAWVSTLLYAGQIYFDFSGYSDMAIGLGRMVGFELPQNFDSPYKAESFSEFWRRWHITLSTWLRDYLYVPLGGNRRGPGRTYLHLILTMLLGGLWHGASWSFAAWGLLHGAFLAVERLAGEPRPSTPERVRWGRRLLVFTGVNVAWVFFRLDDFSRAWLWMQAMFTFQGGLGQVPLTHLAAVALLLLGVWLPKNSAQWRPTYSLPESLLFAALFAASLLVGYGRGISPFLYFRF